MLILDEKSFKKKKENLKLKYWVVNCYNNYYNNYYNDAAFVA